MYKTAKLRNVLQRKLKELNCRAGCAERVTDEIVTTLDVKRGSRVDRGVAVPNITDGFAGRAPDLGAIELGQAPPHYGPRP